MPCWYYEKKELWTTPSIQDGIDYDTECLYRKEGARFIIDTGTIMDLGYNTMATGVVYFHRFYMFHSFKNFPHYVTACGCLFLAGKVEETPKKCKDIIKTAKTLLTEQKFSTFGKFPEEEVMTLERILLQTIKFDLQVEHPYSYLLKYAKCLKGDKSKLQKMVQMAWTFVNDSLCTTLSLQWEPEIIAVALMYLAGKLGKFKIIDWKGRQPKHLRWWDMFVEDVTMDLLEDICHQVLDHYTPANNVKRPDLPPSMSSSKANKERIIVPPTIDSTPGTPNAATPSKVRKIEASITGIGHGCPLVEAVETVTPLEIPTHFRPYPTNYTPSTKNYPVVFPTANISVPTPPVQTINHIVSAMRHLESSDSMRSNPPMPTSGQPFQPYSAYQANTTYFLAANTVPPATAQRPHYPTHP